MMPDEAASSSWSEPGDALRQKALRRLRGKLGELETMDSGQVISLVHELEVYQVELEVQNEELRAAQLRLGEARDRYCSLYEDAPVGYATLDPDRRIQQLNRRSCSLCRRGREDLLGRRFEELVESLDRDRCFLWLREAAAGGEPDSIELRLRRGASSFWALLEITVLDVSGGDAAAGTEAGRGQREFRITISDIDQRKRAELRLTELTEVLEERVRQRTMDVQRQSNQLRMLASQVIRAQQLERRRLSKILHDHIQQLLVAARLQLGGLQDEEEVLRQSRLECLDAILGETLEVSRNLSLELSPPALYEVGLGSALEWLAASMEDKHRLTVDLQVDEGAEPESLEVRCLLYECARELLFNVSKHAGVDLATLALSVDEDERVIALSVTDRGHGFDPAELDRLPGDVATYGLFSIREQLRHLGGSMEIRTAAGQGTTVSLRAPREMRSSESRPAGDSRCSRDGGAARGISPGGGSTGGNA